MLGNPSFEGLRDGIHAAAFTIVSNAPATPIDYRVRIPADPRVVNAAIEIHPCPGAGRITHVDDQKLVLQRNFDQLCALSAFHQRS